MAEETKAAENIVMFPFMAQGHIIPFLALAHRIQRRRPGCSITFVNTPLNIAKLRHSLPPDSSIRLLEIPFSAVDHGLPTGTENTEGIPYFLIYRLVQASVSMKPAFRRLISALVSDDQTPLCIIADMFFPWTAEIAREFGVFHAIFCGGGGFGFGCYYSLWVNLPHKKACSEQEGTGFLELPDFPEAGTLHLTQLAPALLAAGKTEEPDSWTKFQQTTLPGWADSDALLFNTVAEMDSIGLNYFSRTLHRPVWAIGPILAAHNGKLPGTMPEICKQWLDEKPRKSVIYISFGSQNTTSLSQMMQLAMALEASRRNFIWVIRPPLGFDQSGAFKGEEWLPEGFERRIQDTKRGLLVQKWAPQVEILGHGSVAAFVSHGGWNSLLEALSRGVPVMGWPMAADQFYNIKYLEEKLGVCVEVARGCDSELRKEDLMEKIEVVMGEESEKGKEMRRKAGEAMRMMMDAIGNDEEGEGGGYRGSSVKAMDEFFNAAVTTMKERRKIP